MATLEQRPFSRNYSGLINQSVLAGCIIVFCVTSHELMKRKRRGKQQKERLGSVESWEFGYLYQGRSWAKNPSPPAPQGWPLAWVKEVIMFPESKLSELRGVDATLYCRFIRGCFWFTVLHTFTTTAILLPIHIRFSDSQQYSAKSMNRALISSLVQTEQGLRLLWIHLTLMLWVTITWICTLLWISKGAFRYRAQAIEASAEQARQETRAASIPHPHPHPQHPFQSMPPLEKEETNKGLRLRTVMVTNVPSRLRSEKELKEYFEYYMSRPLAKPSIGLTSSTQPGLINKMVSFAFNHVRKYGFSSQSGRDDTDEAIEGRAQHGSKPDIERVSVARKMTGLSSLLDRWRQAHIKLARKTLSAVKEAMDLEERKLVKSRTVNLLGNRRGKTSVDSDIERGSETLEDEIVPEDRTELLIRTLGPYVEEFGMRGERRFLESTRSWLSHTFSKVRTPAELSKAAEKQPASPNPLPRSTLNSYQPLIYLSALFRGRAVAAIDYYTTKVNFLTSLIEENRSRAVVDFEPVSTAFVTFANPDDARRACKYLAVHPKNPLACLVTMAPDYEDLDWVRVMKQTYKAELLKDWVVDLGVWAFTIAWVIPVSLLVALVSISNIATLIPGLMKFLNKHEFLQELIESLLPTLLTSLLVLLIPLILLLIAKKAHTINTLSALHDRILTRYHKFLVANILLFFCVGVTALESFFTSFKSSIDVLQVVGESFPSAGPFYVGWFDVLTDLLKLFSQPAIHGGIELALFGLPLIVYPSTKRQMTPRKHWLPNHVLVVILTLVFSVLNPLLMPFAVLYFAIESVVIKNQLLHVYAKIYEGNGSLLLIRLGRYTLDGLILAQVIFMGFLGVVKKEAQLGLTAVMLVFTVVFKLLFTRICRAKFETADIIESHVVCGVTPPSPTISKQDNNRQDPVEAVNNDTDAILPSTARFKTWKLPKGFKFTYSANAQRGQAPAEHKPIPFDDVTRFKRLQSWDGALRTPREKVPASRPAESMPELENSPCGSPQYATERVTSPLGRPSLVTTHEKHLAWDDSARLDRPYDNPYYIRPIANYLWLPRDPVGILDLDDTVNVFRAITSDPSIGQLGEWVEEGIALEDLPSSLSFSDVSELEHVNRELSGDEMISLPPDIAGPMENIQREEEVEYTEEGRLRRPSMLTRHTSSISDIRGRGLSLAHPTFDVGASSSRNRGMSITSDSTYHRRPSFFSQGSRRPFPIIDTASQHDLHAQAPYIRSRISIATPRIHNARTVSNTSKPVSTREAVVSEVIAEEEAHAELASNAPSTRSWLTSWMFSRVPWTS
ncbi:DUF221-domain-containing protein [Phellopilus nigrolimitatus]|nr:DUF221-domain-containing protein [Phellopilus nigrolimitatus]